MNPTPASPAPQETESVPVKGVVDQLDELELNSPNPHPQVSFVTNVKYLLGLCEESIYECGTSSYVSTLTLLISRSIFAFFNVLLLFWLFTSPKIPKFTLFWGLPVPWAVLALEAWAVFFCALGAILLALCSCKAMNLTEQDMVELYSSQTNEAMIAHAAGTTALTGAVFAIFALVATPVGTPDFPRFVTHAVPISTFLVDIVFGARVRYRLRGIAVPLTLSQVQQALAVFYIWLFQRNLIVSFTNGARFVTLATLYNLVALAAAICFVVVARVTRLCDRAPPPPPLSPHKYAI